MRSLAVVLGVGAAVLLALALTQGSALVYTLGVQPQSVVATLGPGGEACQAPLRLPAGATFERVRFHATGEQIEVTVEGARAVVAGGGPPPADTVADVGPVRAENPVTVCLRNAGSGSVELWGSADIASAGTSATVNGEPLGQDVAIVLERAEERSLLALLPDMAERASLFRAGWLSPVAYGVLALLVLAGVPALLLAALGRARD